MLCQNPHIFLCGPWKNCCSLLLKLCSNVITNCIFWQVCRFLGTFYHKWLLSTEKKMLFYWNYPSGSWSLKWSFSKNLWLKITQSKQFYYFIVCQHIFYLLVSFSGGYFLLCFYWMAIILNFCYVTWYYTFLCNFLTNFCPVFWMRIFSSSWCPCYI